MEAAMTTTTPMIAVIARRSLPQTKTMTMAMAMLAMQMDVLLFLAGTEGKQVGLSLVITYHILPCLSLGSFEELHEFLKDFTLFKMYQDKGEWFLRAFGPQCLKINATELAKLILLAKSINKNVTHFSGDIGKGYECFNSKAL